jgi:hypothetical protein
MADRYNPLRRSTTAADFSHPRDVLEISGRAALRRLGSTTGPKRRRRARSARSWGIEWWLEEKRGASLRWDSSLRVSRKAK